MRQGAPGRRDETGEDERGVEKQENVEGGREGGREDRKQEKENVREEKTESESSGERVKEMQEMFFPLPFISPQCHPDYISATC